MKKKYLMDFFAFYDRSGIASYLEKQAEDGWMFEGSRGGFLRFRRCEVKKIRFAVTYFPASSEFDAQPSENQLRFRAFCEHTGWRHIADRAQMQIYCSEKENPVPIETDALIEVENIHKSAKKAYLPGYFLIFALGVFILFLQILFLSNDVVEKLADPLHLYMTLLGLCEGFLGASELILYYRWYRKAKRYAEENGSFVETHDTRVFRIGSVLLMIAVLGCMILTLLSSKGPYSFQTSRLLRTILIGLPVFYLITAGITVLLKKARVSAKVNRRVTFFCAWFLSAALLAGTTSFIFKDLQSGKLLPESAQTYAYNGKQFTLYKDSLPLAMAELTDTDTGFYSSRLEVSATLLVVLTEAYDRPRLDAPKELPFVEYTIVDVKLPFLFDLCLNSMLDDGNTVLFDDYGGSFIYEYAEIDAEPWNADYAYQLRAFSTSNYRHTYLLCYGQKIVKLDTDLHISDEQKTIIAENLGKR